MYNIFEDPIYNKNMIQIEKVRSIEFFSNKDSDIIFQKMCTKQICKLKQFFKLNQIYAIGTIN